MKTTLTLRKSALIAVLIMASGLTTQAQSKGSGNLIKQDRVVSAFTEIEAGSAFEIILEQGEPITVSVETDDNYLESIITSTNNNRLVIKSSGIRNPTAMRVYIKIPVLTALELDGAARIDSKGELKVTNLGLEASGASKVNLNIDAEMLKSDISGASKVTLRGKAISHDTDVSGAASLEALKLVTQTTAASVSGAARARIYAISELNAEISGAGSVSYYDQPSLKKISKPGSYELRFDNPKQPAAEDTENVLSTTESGDSTLINIGDIKVEVIEGSPTRVKIGNNELEVDDEGNVDFKRNRKDRFDGHWGGFDLGVNGYLNSNRGFDMPEGYEFLDLRMEKSINVAINFWEQNFNLIGNQFGLTTGLGLEWNNYRFDNNVKIIRDEEIGIDAIRMNEEGTGYLKSKMVVNYLNLPILLEYQTNRFSKKNSFHIGGGLMTGLRIGTHTKMVYDDGSKQKDKDRDSKGYDINPFKFALMARIGWGKINLFANYSLNGMFKDNRGPELYPFAAGITLASW
jgi:hypothetical protein